MVWRRRTSTPAPPAEPQAYVSIRQAPGLGTGVYTTPSFHGVPDGVVTLTSTGELRNFFESALSSSIRAQGYDHSATQASTVCPLTDVTALLSVEYLRYRSDRQVLSEGATYLFTKTTSGWRILGQIGHDADRLLGCSD